MQRLAGRKNAVAHARCRGGSETEPPGLRKRPRRSPAIPLGPDRGGRGWAGPHRLTHGEAPPNFVKGRPFQGLAHFPQKVIGERHSFQRRTRLKLTMHVGGYIPDLDRRRHVFRLLPCRTHVKRPKTSGAPPPYGPTTGLVSVPIFSTVMLTVSPPFRKTGGLRANPTPGGVPVEIKSPTSQVTDWER